MFENGGIVELSGEHIEVIQHDCFIPRKDFEKLQEYASKIESEGVPYEPIKKENRYLETAKR